MTPWTDCVEMYWSGDAEAYVTPVADDCVAAEIARWPHPPRIGRPTTSTDIRLPEWDAIARYG